MHHRNIAILLANGRRARVLSRNHDTGHFEDWIHVEAEAAPERFGPGRAGLDGRRRRQDLRAFVQAIAAQLRAARPQAPLAGVVIVAPARMLQDLEAAISADFPVVGKAALDLLAQSADAIGVQMEGRLLEAEGLVEAAGR